jgi:hypothetical protein
MPGMRRGAALVLAPGAVVRARVRGAERPCRVVIVTRGAEAEFHLAWCTATDAAGRLEVSEGRPGEPLYAFVEADGRFRALFARVAATEPIDLGEVAVRGAAVTGTVLGFDGLRRAGVQVLLQPVLEGAAAQPMGQGLLPALLSRVTYTDRAGRFRFDHVPPWPHRCAIAAGLDGLRVIPARGGDDLGSVQLEEGVAATGVVVLPDGAPAAAASVQYMRSPDPTFGSLYLVGRTDAQGHFVVRGLSDGASTTGWAMCARNGAGFISSFQLTAGQSTTITLRPHAGRL